MLAELTIKDAIRDCIVRAVAVVGLAGVALIHLLDAPASFAERPYQGWLYVGLILGCVVAAAVLVHEGDRRAWLATLLLPAGAFVAFVLSRTVGLPGGAGDIGNWTEPLGLASLFVEGLLVMLSAHVLLEQPAESRAVRPEPLRA